jgi:hypothetical protein
VQSFKRLDVWKHEFPTQLWDQGKDLRRRSRKLVETSKDRLQDALDQGIDAFKQAKKAGA